VTLGATRAGANRAILLLVAVAALGLVMLGFLGDAPNRLVDGVSLPLWRAPLPLVLLVAAPLGLLALAGARGAGVPALILAGLLAVALLVAAGLFAKARAVAGEPAQRLSLGAAFWIGLIASGLAMLEAMRAVALGLFARMIGLAGLVVAFAAVCWLNVFDDLSLARELATHRARFLEALPRHVALVGGALLLSILVCAPLVLATRTRARGVVHACLGVFQTIPSIALFGLLIAPLTALAAHVPALKAIGVSGLGVTPALIALVVYSAFPLVRMSEAALAAVPPEVADAAMGLGMSRAARFRAVDWPLALPVLVSGLRVVTLQAIGLATVAALIGGGGLGTFIFEGIGAYALDLVLLGAIPVILLALATDFAFRLLMAAVAPPA
jgi:osmoprotectant transport system permease protein